MPSWFITGAGRGLGLAFTTRLLEDPTNVVIASARNPSSAAGLIDLQAKYPQERLAVIKYDTADFESLSTVVKQTEDILKRAGVVGIDYLLLNAGVDYQTLKTLGNDADYNLWLDEFKINAVAPLAALRAFTPLLLLSVEKKVVFLTSGMGSIAIAGNMPFLGDTYSASKAALNMAVKKAGAAMTASGVPITLLLVHPGLVLATDMGGNFASWFGKYAPDYPVQTVDESITGVLKLAVEATSADHTKFYDYSKTELQW